MFWGIYEIIQVTKISSPRRGYIYLEFSELNKLVFFVDFEAMASLGKTSTSALRVPGRDVAYDAHFSFYKVF